MRNLHFRAPLGAVLLLALVATPALAGKAVTSAAMTLREGPGDSFAELIHISAGSLVDLHECNERQWCRVDYRDWRGWVHVRGVEEASRRGGGGAGSSTMADGGSSGGSSVGGGSSDGGGSKGSGGRTRGGGSSSGGGDSGISAIDGASLPSGGSGGSSTAGDRLASSDSNGAPPMSEAIPEGSTTAHCSKC